MELKEKIRTAPLEPGCYLFKDNLGNIIYVGKAKILRNRVKQYFMESNQKDDKGFMLGKLIRDVAFVLTETERDALMEEYRLIKYHKPWFNRQHKIERNMSCFIKLNRLTPYTFFEITHEKTGNSKDYFGAYRNDYSAKEAIVLLNKVFKTPLCGQVYQHTNHTPCLYYQINQCFGPCAGKADVEVYNQMIMEMVNFFKGKQAPVLKRLKKEMQEKINQLAFEQAAEIKTAIDDIIWMGKRNQLMIEIPVHRDALILFRAFREQGFTMYYVHQNAVVGRCDFADQLVPAQLSEFLSLAPSSFEQQRALATLPMLQDVHGQKMVILLPVKRNLQKATSLVTKRYWEGYAHETILAVPEKAGLNS